MHICFASGHMVIYNNKPSIGGLQGESTRTDEQACSHSGRCEGRDSINNGAGWKTSLALDDAGSIKGQKRRYFFGNFSAFQKSSANTAKS